MDSSGLSNTSDFKRPRVTGAKFVFSDCRTDGIRKPRARRERERAAWTVHPAHQAPTPMPMAAKQNPWGGTARPLVLLRYQAAEPHTSRHFSDPSLNVNTVNRIQFKDV